MRPSKSFFFSKVSDTSADIFTAIGFAYLMAESFPSLKDKKDIWIRDRGPYYEVEFFAFTQDEEPLCNLPIVEPVVTEAQKSKRSGLVGYDWGHQQAIITAYHKRIRELPASQRFPVAIREWNQQADIPLPHPLYEQYKTISVLQATDTFNEIALRWSVLSHEHKKWHLKMLLTLFEAPFKDINSVDETIRSWKQFARGENISGHPEVTALQIINPTQGKGSNSPKANNLTLGSMKQFWLLEFLKFIGFLHASLSYTVRGGTDDRKIYVPHPRNITLHRLLSSIQDMRDLCWSDRHIQLDVQLLLLCTSLLVEERREYLQENFPYPPLTGWETTHYKFMGKAYILMNTCLLGLPCWMSPATSPQECDTLLELINHHRNLLRQLNEQHEKERQMLEDYRDFLSANDSKALLNFAAAYGTFFFNTKARDAESFLPMFKSSDIPYLFTRLSA